jgi:hypothetical protein
MPDTQQRGRGLARWLASAFLLAGVVAATGVLWLRFNAPPGGAAPPPRSSAC